LIPGLTFQLLAASPTAVQVVIANDNSAVESTVAQFVSDFNSLVSAINTQEGNTSSGTPEPLYGSPTLSLLQQEILSGINTQNPSGYLDAIAADGSATLSGSITLQVGSGTAQTFAIGTGDASNGTIYTGSGANTLADLASAINSAQIGVTAAVVTSKGKSSLTLTSETSGAGGALAVSSALTASSGASTTPLAYTNSSDLTSLSALGISVNNNGTLSLNATALDSLLNTDFSSVQGLFQNAHGWGLNFSAMLEQAGSSSSTGLLKLAAASDSSVEATLNAKISAEDSLIAARQASLTTELNKANETLQAIPMQLNEINELYSAITGYNKNANG
jgi:flagellar hook-associated protein 2